MSFKHTRIIELEPTNNEKKVQEPSKWLEVFNKLAELIDQDESRGQKVVNLKDLKEYMSQVSAFQIEYDTGIPKDQLVLLANKLKKADKNQDGTICLAEWEDWVHRIQGGPKTLVDNDHLNTLLNVIGYAPRWTCRPPTLFIILMSCLQVIFYLLQ